MKLSNYHLGEVIGKGGTGTVYRATHRGTGAAVAVKVMSRASCSNKVLVQRFKQEYSASSRLRHPNIVRALGVGEDDGVLFLVMELVPGTSLGRHVSREGPLGLARCLALGTQLASALDLVHQHQLIHRDVKPENVLLDPDGRAKLTDLGLVKDLGSDEALTKSGTWLGTIAYMAPEQFGEAHRADATCDVYGLAATLYFALTGVAPFHGGNLTVLGKKLQGDFRPPSQLVRALPKGFDEVLARALSPDVARRPRSCRELVAELPTGPAEAATGEEGDERRRAKRYPTCRRALFRPMRAGPQRWAGEVLDISLTGLRLHLNRRFEQGTVLEIAVADTAGELATFLVRTAWARPLPDGWAVGCTFSRTLSDGDLAVFLGETSGTVAISTAE